MSYDTLTARAPKGDLPGFTAFLRAELCDFWLAHYWQNCERATCIVEVDIGTFVYVYDQVSDLVKKGVLPSDPFIPDRLVGVYGTSAPPVETREKSRIRNWVAPTEEYYGKGRDKGHAIGRALGGGAHGPGINTWDQERALNRGWSERGRVFRKMEKYCAQNPGTFCFTRARYVDQKSKPKALEFGIAMPDCSLWVEEFEN